MNFHFTGSQWPADTQVPPPILGLLPSNAGAAILMVAIKEVSNYFLSTMLYQLPGQDLYNFHFNTNSRIGWTISVWLVSDITEPLVLLLLLPHLKTKSTLKYPNESLLATLMSITYESIYLLDTSFNRDPFKNFVGLRFLHAPSNQSINPVPGTESY